MSSPEQLNDVKPTKPKEVKLRRYGLYRMIPGVDLPEGQELLTVGKQAFIFLGLVDETPKIYLDADGLPDTKQRFNYFSRDADFDGDVQDGTPHQRRSRSLTHLIFSRRAERPKRTQRERLRDLPVEVLFPNGPSKPTPESIKKKPKEKELSLELWRNDFPFSAKAAKKPQLGTFSGGAEIGKGKISIDGPGIRHAVSKGAVVDEAGHLRCPPTTPGAMQFTNWRLEGCGTPRRITRKKIQLAAEELAEFTAAGGQTVSAADITNFLAAREDRTIGATPNIRQRQRISRRLQGTSAKKATTGESFTGLAELFKKSKSDSVRLDLTSGDVPGSGLAVPRSESSIALDMSVIADSNGNLTEEGAAQIVDWLDEVMNESGRDGAISSMVTITQVQPPKRPYDPEKPPLSGKAQELADLAGGDFNKFMELLADQEIVIFDFETTGMGADGNMPVEVAALRVRNGKVIDRKHIYMNPGRPMGDWSRNNLKGPDGSPLTDEWLSDQASLKDAMQELTDFMGDSIVVAHNAPFDTEILDRVTAEQGIEFKPAGVIDTLALSRQMIPKSETPEGRHTLQALAQHFDVKMDSWHTAWSDTDSLVGIMEGLRQRGIDTPVDPKILDGDYQAEKYAAAVAKFNADTDAFKAAMAEHEATWGTKKSVARLDVHDIFDEKATGSKKAKQEAFQTVLDMADQEGAAHVIRLSDGSVTSVADDTTPRVGEFESTLTPTRARINDAKTRLAAAFGKLEGKDNMNLDAFTQKQVTKMLEEWQKVPGFEWIDPSDPDHLYLAIDQGARNIYRLAESADPRDREIHRRWYEAANKFAADLGEHHGFAQETATAVIAVLSPTQDWNGNIALGDHVMSLVRDENFTVSDELAQTVASSIASAHRSSRSSSGSLTKKINDKETAIAGLKVKISDFKTSISSSDDLKKAEAELADLEKVLADLRVEFAKPPLSADQIKGKKLAELDLDTKARVVKFHAQFYGGEYMDQPSIPGKGKSLRAYSMDVDTDGSYQLGTLDNRVRVQSLTQYKKALRILEADKDKKPNLAVINKELGRGSKVRSFHNNILHPNDERYADVTADTHHFGAATLVPVSSSHKVLDAIFKSANASGASSAYPLVRAMTILATARWNAEHDDDLMPRAMQSIAWERIRSMIPTKFENPRKPGEVISDSSLKSYMTDTAAQIARLASGDKPRRRDLAGREVELLEELSTALQKVPKGDARKAVLEDFRKRYKLPKLKEEDKLPREIKVRSDGTIVSIDKETGEEIIDEDLPDEVLEAIAGGQRIGQIKREDVAFIRTRQDDAVTETASKLHESWRAPRKREDGTFEPRMKDDGSGGEVDIANTPYAELPTKWQEENKLAAQHAVEAILADPDLSDDSIADLVHQEWLKRNGSWAPESQKLPYAELSQEEKDKDLAVVAAARESLLSILESKPKTGKRQSKVLLAKGVLFPVR